MMVATILANVPGLPQVVVITEDLAYDCGRLVVVCGQRAWCCTYVAHGCPSVRDLVKSEAASKLAAQLLKGRSGSMRLAAWVAESEELTIIMGHVQQRFSVADL